MKESVNVKESPLDADMISPLSDAMSLLLRDHIDSDDESIASSCASLDLHDLLLSPNPATRLNRARSHSPPLSKKKVPRSVRKSRRVSEMEELLQQVMSRNAVLQEQVQEMREKMSHDIHDSQLRSKDLYDKTIK